MIGIVSLDKCRFKPPKMEIRWHKYVPTIPNNNMCLIINNIHSMTGDFGQWLIKLIFLKVFRKNISNKQRCKHSNWSVTRYEQCSPCTVLVFRHTLTEIPHTNLFAFSSSTTQVLYLELKGKVARQRRRLASL